LFGCRLKINSTSCIVLWPKPLDIRFVDSEGD